MAVTIRKWATFIDEQLEEGGKPLARPLRRVAVAAVVKNPYAGRNPDELTELIDLGEVLGDELMRRCQEALGTPVEAYGKGGIVGEAGELEHIAAILHPKFGAPTRTRVGGHARFNGGAAFPLIAEAEYYYAQDGQAGPPTVLRRRTVGGPVWPSWA